MPASFGAPVDSESGLPRVALVAATVAAVVATVLLGASLLAFPFLRVDGGWYSYPGFALSQGWDASAHQLPLAEVSELRGPRALFDWSTQYSPRALYSAVWFWVWGGNHLSLISLSLLEFSVLLLAARLLYRQFFKTRWLALFSLLLLLTNKGLGMGAASDSRPDLALGAVSCFLYVHLRREARGAPWVILAVALAALAATIHLTSPIPLAFVFTAAAIDALAGDPEERRRRLYFIIALVAVAAVAFFLREPVFRGLLGSAAAASDPVDVFDRIAGSWSVGVSGLFTKEVGRWIGHFYAANLPQLLAILLGAMLLRSVLRDRATALRIVGPLAGLVVAFVTSALLNPHTATNHIYPLVPFYLLLLAPIEVAWVRRGPLVLAILVLLSSAMSVAYASRTTVRYHEMGVNNSWLKSTLAEQLGEDRSYLVVGGTELWPYLPQGRDVLLLDRTRRPEDFTATYGFALSEVDLIMASPDYLGSGWYSKIRELEAQGLARLTVDVKGFLTVAALDSSRESDK